MKVRTLASVKTDRKMRVYCDTKWVNTWLAISLKWFLQKVILIWLNMAYYKAFFFRLVLILSNYTTSFLYGSVQNKTLLISGFENQFSELDRNRSSSISHEDMLWPREEGNMRISGRISTVLCSWPNQPNTVLGLEYGINWSIGIRLIYRT